MSDLMWFMIIGFLFAMLGMIFSRLGWYIWKKQRIDLIISFHSDKVSEENKQAYCTLFGIGILFIGIGFLLSGISTVNNHSVLVFVPMAVGLVFGFALLITAITKYNR
ncbi:MAG: DUF3784 domain-containing protein [Erysipelotrichaceae bacterium]|nr:DUF3784 domain-containing protein [Erysipelotrichaceae bacterium]